MRFGLGLETADSANRLAMFWFALLTGPPGFGGGSAIVCLTGKAFALVRAPGGSPARGRGGEAVEQATRLLSLSGRPARAPASRRSRLKQASRLLHCRQSDRKSTRLNSSHG